MPPEWLQMVTTLLWRIKGTMLVLIVIGTVGFFTGGGSNEAHRRLLDQFGFDFDDLTNARFWHFLTGTWLQSSPGIAWSMVALVFGGTVFLELFAGTPAMLVTCVTGDWIATFLTVLTLRVLAGFGDASVIALLSTPDAGTSALAHAGYGAAVTLLPRRWLRIALPALVVLTAIQFFIVSLAPAIVHCWAALYGALVGWLVLRPRLTAGGHAYPTVWEMLLGEDRASRRAGSGRTCL